MAQDTTCAIAALDCRALVARRYLTRLLGLFSTKAARHGAEAILFPRCSSVHTFFMSHQILVCGLCEVGEGAYKVLWIQRLSPWRVSMRDRDTTAILEIANCERADMLRLAQAQIIELSDERLLR